MTYKALGAVMCKQLFCIWRANTNLSPTLNNLLIKKNKNIYIPFETDKVEIVVLLCQEVTKNTSWVSTPDLVSRQRKIYTLGEVPQLGNCVVGKTSATTWTAAHRYNTHTRLFNGPLSKTTLVIQ